MAAEEDTEDAAPSENKETSLLYMKVMKMPSLQPGKAFACACSVHCCLFLLFLVLTVGLGGKFLNFSTEVALHIWDSEWQMRANAIAEGRKICTWDPALQVESQRQQEENRIPKGTSLYELQIVYKARDGNMLDQNVIMKVKELEDYVVNRADFPKFCLRATNTTSCKTPKSAIMACVPSLTGNATDCSMQKSNPPGFFQCENASGCPRNQWTTSSDFVQVKARQYASASYMVDYPETRVLQNLDSSFGSGNTVALAMQSTFEFGFPLEGYTSTEDRPGEQKDKIETFMTDSYFDKLENFNFDEADDAGFKIGYQGGNLLNDSINALLYSEFAKVFGAFAVVFVYVMIMTKSVWYATLIMGQIFLCFTSGFLLYRLFFFNPFFGSFHILAIFLIVGIGVDDLFVMLDHFEAAVVVDERYRDDLWARMSWTWKHAAVAMGVTSFTTAMSFIMNAMSSFAGIKSFGIFAAMLVITNYISMIAFFPTVVTFANTKLKDSKCCCGVPDMIEARLLAKKPQGGGEDAEGAGGPEGPSKPALVRFFEDHFSYFILGHRIKICLLFLVVSIIFFTQLPNLEPEKEAASMLPADYPLNQYLEIMRTQFITGGGMFNTRVQLVFGYTSEIIDQDGTDSTGGGFGDTDKIGSRGEVKWNPNFYNDSAMTMQNWDNIARYMPCGVQLCDSGEAMSSDRHTGGPPAYRMKGCWARDLKRYIAANHNISIWDDIVQGNGTLMWQYLFQMTASDEDIATEMGDYTFAESVNGEPVFRYYVAEVTLTSDQYIDFEIGNKMAKAWKDWLAADMRTGDCSAVTGELPAFVYSASFIEFHNREILIQEMIQGLGISLGIAIIILILVTGNIFIGGLAGLTIAGIVLWVLSMIPIFGWTLGMTEVICLVMVPGLSVDYVAHMAEAYNGAKFDDRGHRVIKMLEHSGVSVISGCISTLLAAGCLFLCQVTFFQKFGTFIFLTISFSVCFALFFFPSVLALLGPTGEFGDWHKYIHPKLQRRDVGEKKLRVSPTTEWDEKNHAIWSAPGA